MRRLVVVIIIKTCGKAILFAAIASMVIGVIGNLKEWDSPLAYSNAFFMAGCLMIVAGASSRLGANQEWRSFQSLNAESFRNMSSGERVSFIINVSSSFNLVIVGLLSGILLILISAILL